MKMPENLWKNMMAQFMEVRKIRCTEGAGGMYQVGTLFGRVHKHSRGSAKYYDGAVYGGGMWRIPPWLSSQTCTCG